MLSKSELTERKCSVLSHGSSMDQWIPWKNYKMHDWDRPIHGQIQTHYNHNVQSFHNSDKQSHPTCKAFKQSWTGTKGCYEDDNSNYSYMMYDWIPTQQLWPIHGQLQKENLQVFSDQWDQRKIPQLKTNNEFKQNEKEHEQNATFNDNTHWSHRKDQVTSSENENDNHMLPRQWHRRTYNGMQALKPNTTQNAPKNKKEELPEETVMDQNRKRCSAHDNHNEEDAKQLRKEIELCCYKSRQASVHETEELLSKCSNHKKIEENKQEDVEVTTTISRSKEIQNKWIMYKNKTKLINKKLDQMQEQSKKQVYSPKVCKRYEHYNDEDKHWNGQNRISRNSIKIESEDNPHSTIQKMPKKWNNAIRQDGSIIKESMMDQFMKNPGIFHIGVPMLSHVDNMNICRLATLSSLLIHGKGSLTMK